MRLKYFSQRRLVGAFMDALVREGSPVFHKHSAGMVVTMALAVMLTLSLAAQEVAAQERVRQEQMADAGVAGTSPVSTTQYQPNAEVEAFLDGIRAARGRQQAYSGTFVVSDGQVVTSTRTRYACDGRQFVESMESLGGRPHTTAYDDQRMYSVLPDEKRMVIAPYYRSVIPLHALHKANLKELSRYYRMRPLRGERVDDVEVERVAGLPARVVMLYPQDDLRYGYRIWLNSDNQWVLKMQTVHGERVLESVVFTHINVEKDAGQSLHDLRENTRPPAGFVVEGGRTVAGTASVPSAYDDWVVGEGLPGFQVVQQQAVPVEAGSVEAAVGRLMAAHWLLSDGLATVSVFAEPFRAGVHRSDDDGRVMRLGASTMYSRRRGGQWVVATGEVPVKTLKLLVDELELMP